jgi:serine/threonine-protein kinase
MLHLRELFEAACELPPSERAAFVATLCGDDAVLAEELSSLLAQDLVLERSRTMSAVGIASEQFAVAPLQAGAPLGPYRVLSEIGHGGMGRVFRARRADGAFEKDVAIKVVRRDLLAPGLLERFSTERAVLGSLEHSNIARLIDAAVTSDGTPYFVMELVEGGDILAWCNARRLRIRERVALFRKVVDAVAHAHRKLVVHRDIKASNVLVNAEGEPKLLDFGIAKPLALDARETATHERFFTPHAAAPEQLRGEPVSVACDVYALGVLLYELLSGTAPFDFEGLTAGQIEQLVLGVPPRPMASAIGADEDAAREHGCVHPRTWRAQLEGDLEAIVQRALRKEPAARYATAEQLDADLADYLANRPVRARGSQRLYRARKFIARHRAAVAFALLSASILVATTVTIALQNVELARERDRVALERDRAEQVVDLLRSFEAADPGKSRAGAFTAAEVLKAAHDRLDTLKDQPELYMHLTQVIARVEVGIGMLREAAEITTHSVETLESRLPPADIAPLRLSQARFLTQAGEFAAAERALLLAAPYVDTNSPEYLLASTRVHDQHGRYAEALADAERLVASVRARGPDDPLTDGANYRLAEALRHLDRSEEALAVLQQTLAWQLARREVNTADVLRTKIRIVNEFGLLGRSSEMLALAQEILPEVERVFGVESTISGSVLNALGNALKKLGRPAEAADHYRRTLAIFLRGYGHDHPRTYAVRYNLAVLLADHDATLAEAEALYRACVEYATRRLPPDHLAHTSYRIGYAEVLLRLDRPRDALAVLAGNPGGRALSRMPQAQSDRFRALLTRTMEAAACAGTTGGDDGASCAAAAALLEAASKPQG